MKKLVMVLVPLLTLSNIVLANPINHMFNNSVSEAIRESVIAAEAADIKSNKTRQAAAFYSHENQKYNSLSASVLAIQGVKANIAINASSHVDYSRYIDTHERNNSFFRGVLAR
ncbi:MAG: hypothetical protein P1P93_02595 [Gammaproteobacteria bacterium]|nr:hypothetical protein [Gammaproteobacteria bacterium]